MIIGFLRYCKIFNYRSAVRSDSSCNLNKFLTTAIWSCMGFTVFCQDCVITSCCSGVVCQHISGLHLHGDLLCISFSSCIVSLLVFETCKFVTICTFFIIVSEGNKTRIGYGTLLPWRGSRGRWPRWGLQPWT